MTIPDLDELLAVLAAGDRPGDALVPSSEGLDQLAHGLQCAHELALSYPDDEELQVAGLVHDIGHQLVPGDDAGHGRVAADAVRDLLGARVADLVELHVPAKRYLVTRNPGYGDVLSDVSTTTLARQGGPMSAAEVAAFVGHPCVDHALALRIADDAAKVPGRAVPGLDHWRPTPQRVAGRHLRSVPS